MLQETKQTFSWADPFRLEEQLDESDVTSFNIK